MSHVKWDCSFNPLSLENTTPHVDTLHFTPAIRGAEVKVAGLLNP